MEFGKIYLENGTVTRVLSHIRFISISSPTFSTEIVNCSNTLSWVSEGTSKVSTSFFGSRLASPLKLMPHCPYSELNITVQVCSPGMVHRVYVPAFSFLPPILISWFVSKVVASLAPVLHTFP